MPSGPDVFSRKVKQGGRGTSKSTGPLGSAARQQHGETKPCHPAISTWAASILQLKAGELYPQHSRSAVLVLRRRAEDGARSWVLQP